MKEKKYLSEIEKEQILNDIFAVKEDGKFKNLMIENYDKAYIYSDKLYENLDEKEKNLFDKTKQQVMTNLNSFTEEDLECIKYLARLMNTYFAECIMHSALIEDNLIYYSSPIKGSMSVIINSNNYEYLLSNSFIDYNQHLQNYRDGMRTKTEENGTNEKFANLVKDVQNRLKETNKDIKESEIINGIKSSFSLYKIDYLDSCDEKEEYIYNKIRNLNDEDYKKFLKSTNEYKENWNKELIDEKNNNVKQRLISEPKTIKVMIQDGLGINILSLMNIGGNKKLLCCNDEVGKFIDLDDNSLNLSEDEFNEFNNKLTNIISNWENIYYGNEDNIIWSITIVGKETQNKIIGSGNYPNNWNCLVKLLSNYEVKYKEKIKKNDTDEKFVKNITKNEIDDFLSTLDNKIKELEQEKKYEESINLKTYVVSDFIKFKNDTEENNKYHFYKKNPDDKVWWIENNDNIGEHLFSFDKINIFNLFKDYPYNLTSEEKEIFDAENSYWVEFFKDRK